MRIFVFYLALVLIFTSLALCQSRDDQLSEYYRSGSDESTDVYKKMTSDEWEKTVKDRPEDIEAWYGYSVALYEGHKYDKAVEIIIFVTENILPSDNISLGDFYNIQGNCIRASTLKSGIPIVKAGNGDGVLVISQEYKDALNCYNLSIGLDANYTSAWNNKGIALGELRLFNESVACFDEGVRIDPDFAEAWNNKGVTLDYWNRHEESIECYNRAIGIDAFLAEAWYNKAKTLSLNLSNYAEAKECYNRSVELDPSLKEEVRMWLYKETVQV